MSNHAERRAAQLFDQYLNDAMSGKALAAEHYLSQCPKGAVEELRGALSSADFLLEHYYCPRMKKSTVTRLLGRFQEIQRQQQAVRQARERAQTTDIAREAPINDPVEYLRDLFDFPTALVAAPQAASAARPQFAVMNRGEALPAAQRRALIDDAQLRTMERILPAKAEEVLHQVMISEPPVDVAQVAEELGLFVQEARLPAGLDGCIVTDGTVGGILINKAIEEVRRRRFTLGHEIAHFVLHKHEVKVLTESVDEVGSFFLTRLEQEANTFASYLLMPPFLIPQELEKAPPSFEVADQLVECFDVSLAAALRRVVRESHWRCALVVTQEGMVRWAVRSHDFEGYVATGTRPHRDTMAALLLRTDGPDEDTTQLPGEAWIEGPLLEEEVELREHSRRLANGYVYTLLTVIEGG